MASVMEASVTPDLQYAKIYITVMDTANMQKRTMETLTHAAGYIAREMAKLVKLRRVPQLTFVQDTSIEYALNMAKLIDSVVKKDEQQHD